MLAKFDIGTTTESSVTDPGTGDQTFVRAISDIADPASDGDCAPMSPGDEPTTPTVALNGSEGAHCGPNADRAALGPRETAASE